MQSLEEVISYVVSQVSEVPGFKKQLVDPRGVFLTVDLSENSANAILAYGPPSSDTPNEIFNASIKKRWAEHIRRKQLVVVIVGLEAPIVSVIRL